MQVVLQLAGWPQDAQRIILQLLQHSKAGEMRPYGQQQITAYQSTRQKSKNAGFMCAGMQSILMMPPSNDTPEDCLTVIAVNHEQASMADHN